MAFSIINLDDSSCWMESRAATRAGNFQSVVKYYYPYRVIGMIIPVNKSINNSFLYGSF
jgi:hypothetical protein